MRHNKQEEAPVKTGLEPGWPAFSAVFLESLLARNLLSPSLASFFAEATD
jgi:hypothetical protein